MVVLRQYQSKNLQEKRISLLDEHSLGFATYCYKNNFTRKVIAGNGNPAQELGSNKSCLRSVISFPDPTTHLIYTWREKVKGCVKIRAMPKRKPLFRSFHSYYIQCKCIHHLSTPANWWSLPAVLRYPNTYKQIKHDGHKENFQINLIKMRCFPEKGVCWAKGVSTDYRSQPLEHGF